MTWLEEHGRTSRRADAASRKSFRRSKNKPPRKQRHLGAPHREIARVKKCRVADRASQPADPDQKDN